MSSGDISKRDDRTALDAYRAAACAEADAHFDERALEAQRHKILARLAHLGHPAKVIRFPKAGAAERPSQRPNHRWISVAAAAGLILGLLGGQLVHFVPRAPRQSVAAPTMSSSLPGPSIVQVSAPTDDALLDEIEVAMEVRSASALRALDAFTPIPDSK